MTRPYGIPRTGGPLRERSGGGGADVHLGGILGGLGGLLGNLAGFLEAAEQRSGTFQGEIAGLGDKVKGVFGVSIRMAGGQPVLESFGDIHPEGRSAGLAQADARAPLVDVFEEPDAIQIVAELPGVEEADIRWALSGDNLELRAQGRFRHYIRDIGLPAPVEAVGATQSFRNGVLELKMPRRSDRANGG